jgi:hypothetical protein
MTDIFKVTDYLAIIYIGGGSSWARAKTGFDAIKEAKEICERDWGSMFTFSDEPAYIAVYDVSKTKDWYADTHGVFDGETQDLVPHLYTVTAKLKNKGKK